MFERIKLPYSYDELEPCIDAETVKTHYEKHHKTYTDNLNKLLEKAPDLKKQPIEEILRNLNKAPAEIRTGLKNNGGGYYIHNLYFESMTPGGKDASSKLNKMIDEAYGSMDEMLEKLFEAATATLFGSGWAWLVHKNGKLDITISPNQDLPEGNPTLLLPVDMWEHAYYLKYKNEKKEYVKEFFKVIDWDCVEKRLEGKK